MSRRIERINKLLSNELAQIIHATFTESLGIITINHVDTSLDLSRAKIWISVLDQKPQNIDNTVSKINKCGPFFRYTLTKKLNLKTIPQLEFVLDKNIDKVQKIESLLYRINKEENKPCEV